MTQPETQFFVDPKIALTLSLVRQTERVAFNLEARRFMDAANGISVLLDRLEIKETFPEKDELETLKKSIAYDKMANLSILQIREAFRLVCHYLNYTYFKGFDGAINESFFKELEEGENNEG